jgi:RimJ/RimL family protein N-acetyltransferase
MIKFVMCAKRHPNLSQTDFQDRQDTIALRPIRVEDIAAIKSWPIYVDGFEQMDYALREHGWLDEFWQKPDTWIYIAELNKQVTGFSLLSTTSEGAAEFRIAIHPLWTGKGLGKKITVATLKTGFRQLNLNHVHLIVRKNNSRAAKLYESLDFAYTGESIHTIQGKRIEFKDMAMTKQRFNNLDNEED